MIDASYLVSGALLALVVFGPYFRGAGFPESWRIAWRRIWAECCEGLTRGWLVWAVWPALTWLALYIGLVLHVRFGLGRWPTFGEPMPTLALKLHLQVVWIALGTLVGSLYAVGAILAVALFFRRWRHVAIYALAYGASAAMAFAAAYLAPRPFLNWFLD